MKLGGIRTRYGLLAALVMALALLSGVAVAGLPEAVPDDIRAAQIRPPASVPSTEPQDSSPATSSEAQMTEPPPTATAPTSTALGAASTTPPSVTATAPTPLPPSEVRVVVANAAAADGLAGRVAEQARGLGYEDVVATNAVDRRAVSVVYYSPEYEIEAEALAGALGIAAIEPQPAEQITVDGTAADLWVVLGGDRLENE